MFPNILFVSNSLHEPVPWDRGELLSQSLDVCELDSLSSTPGFYHLSLNNGQWIKTIRLWTKLLKIK